MIVPRKNAAGARRLRRFCRGPLAPGYWGLSRFSPQRKWDCPLLCCGNFATTVLSRRRSPRAGTRGGRVRPGRARFPPPSAARKPGVNDSRRSAARARGRRESLTPGYRQGLLPLGKAPRLQSGGVSGQRGCWIARRRKHRPPSPRPCEREQAARRQQRRQRLGHYHCRTTQQNRIAGRQYRGHGGGRASQSPAASQHEH